MKKLVTLLICVSSFFAMAQDDIVQANIKGLLDNNQNQITSLAQAFSEEQFNWRPSDGVRSVGEAILHVASANYYLVSKLGFAPPEDVNIMTLEKITGKDNVVSELKKSFDFVHKHIGQVKTADFSKEVDLGFAKLSTLSTLLVVLEHSGEHKGQLIAYARSNGITPPWSN